MSKATRENLILLGVAIGIAILLVTTTDLVVTLLSAWQGR
jgi:hypothetical protein